MLEFMRDLDDLVRKVANHPNDDMWELAEIAELSPADFQSGLSIKMYSDEKCEKQFLSEYADALMQYFDQMKIPQTDRIEIMEQYWNLPVYSREFLGCNQ